MIITLCRRRGVKLWWALIKTIPKAHAILTRSGTNWLMAWWLALRLALCNLHIGR